MNRLITRYGPWAIIAGASEGLGASYARYLAQIGFNVILIARREKNLSNLAEELETDYNIETETKVLDLRNTDELADYIQGHPMDIGLAVYNAAYAPLAYFSDNSIEDLEMITAVNVRSALIFTKVIVDRYRSNKKSGGVVLMSSMAGNQGAPRLASYAASKSFNTILAEGLWHELKVDNIDVIASVAGAIRTPGYAKRSSTKEAPGTLDPEEVVVKTLQKLGKRPIVIPGIINAIGRFVMTRLLPKSLAIQMMHNNTKSLR